MTTDLQPVGPAAGRDHGANALGSVSRHVGPDQRVLVIAESADLVSGLADRGCRVVWLTPSGSPAPAASVEAVVIDGVDGTGWIDQLGPDPFDLVLTAGVLEFVQDPAAFLGAVKSRLAPEGSIVAVIPNVAHGTQRLALLHGNFPSDLREQPGSVPRRFYTRAAIEALFARAGLAIRRLDRDEEPIAPPETPDRIGAIAADLIGALAADPDALAARFIVQAGREIGSGNGHDRTNRDQPAAELTAVWDELADLRRLIDQQAGQLEVLAGQIAQAGERAGEAWARLLDDQGRLLAAGDGATLAGLSGARAGLAGLSFTHLARRQLRRAVDPCQALAYERSVYRIRGIVRAVVPPGATVLVVSRGDDELIKFDGRIGQHFLQTADGTYAGHHPADSDEAVAALAARRRAGAAYLLIPAASAWWLDHYAGFAHYLDREYRVLVRQDDTCLIFGPRGG